MERGQKIANKGLPKGLRRLFNEQGLTVLGLSKVLDLSREQTHYYLNYPCRMTIERLYLVSGYVGCPPLELFALIHYSRSVASPELKNTLKAIVEKVARDEGLE